MSTTHIPETITATEWRNNWTIRPTDPQGPDMHAAWATVHAELADSDDQRIDRQDLHDLILEAVEARYPDTAYTVERKATVTVWEVGRNGPDCAAVWNDLTTLNDTPCTCHACLELASIPADL